MPLTAPRLPGLRFETVRPAPPPGLPRMDVAAFVGFAAAGPVGVPVAIDDEVRFREVFGADLPLAWDRERGETVFAHLGPAVREFFRNGGRRCWIVRAADEAALEAAAFRVPGLLHGRGRRLDAAFLLASSPGSWADGISLNAALLAEVVPRASLSRETQGVAMAAESPELLRLAWMDGTVAFFPPHPAPPERDAPAAARAAGRVRHVAHSYWFRPAALDDVAGAGPAAFLEGAREVPLPGSARWSVAGNRLEIELPPRAAPGLQAGCWIRVRMDGGHGAAAELAPVPELAEGGGGSGGEAPGIGDPVALADPASEAPALCPGEVPGLLGRDAYLLVDEVIPGERATRVRVEQAWRTLHAAKAWRDADLGEADAALVSLELWTRHADGSVVRLPRIGLVPGHPAFLDDAAGTLLRPPAPDAVAALAALAGDDDEDGGGTRAFLPLGVPAVARDDFHQAATVSGRDPLVRDGLGAFSAELFLDPLLGRLPVATLLDTAFHNAYVAVPPAPPTRMHALLPVEEVSLLAVPDAVHTGWRLRPEEGPPEVPAPPEPGVPAPVEGTDLVRLAWSAVEGARGYLLQDSPDPRFRAGVRDTATTVRPGDDGTAARVRLAEPCPDRRYFRVRALTDAGPTAWSRTVLLEPGAERFDVCGRAPLEAPELEIPDDTASAERIVVRWGPAPETPELAARRAAWERMFRVERAPDPTFSLPEPVFEGPYENGDGTRNEHAEVWMPASGTLYLRAASWLRERAGGRIVEESPWSLAASRGTEPPLRWEVVPRAEADGAAVTAVHEAMLRLAAARSDCFAVLALPRHWREGEALAHVAALSASLGGGEGGQGGAGARTLSFGALYHPWTVVRTPSAAAPLRAVPPDGALCGVMAARANGPGAWTAPANQTLAGVAALVPKLPETVRADLLGRRVNVVAAFPRGFATWSEETLSDDPDLVSVGVRRLLILLRRLALREGNTYVFEANDPAFRRMVQRQFDALLGELYVRGAFRGRTHEEGYRVVTDLTVNPRERSDLGQMVVELRVAPSRPMAFLTVRLVQSGAGIAVEEG